MQTFCGDALCKKPIERTPTREGPWPLRKVYGVVAVALVLLLLVAALLLR